MFRDLLVLIRDNIIGFDTVIIVLAAITFVYLFAIFASAKRVYQTIHTESYLPDDVGDGGGALPASKHDLKQKRQQLRKMRDSGERGYSIYVSVCSTFPLLGILGTIVALIPMVQSGTDLEANFFAALTSTFWGLGFAVIFKIFEGSLAPRIERNNRGLDEYLYKLERKLESYQDVPTAPKITPITTNPNPITIPAPPQAAATPAQTATTTLPPIQPPTSPPSYSTDEVLPI